MNPKILTAILCIAALSGFAQTNKPTFVRGTMEIKFETRSSTDSDGKPKPTVADRYTLNLNMSDSTVFRGGISYTPLITGMLDRIVQPASLNYQIDCDVVNPANPQQTKNVGRLYGLVPIDPNGTYKFSAGSLKLSINAIGVAQGFESKFGGTASGKPLLKSESLLNKAKKEVLNITKQVQGKTVAIAVKKYDKMVFNAHTLGAGPVQYYPAATVNGEMVYDYDRAVWYFKDVSISYVVDGKQLVDRLTGNIRWIESPQRKRDGAGEYQFDVRVNEPPPGEANIFAGASDEAAFFQTDDTIAALVGSMKYKDTFIGEKVTASTVAVELTGNKLSRQQCMNLTKLILLSSVVPLNSE